LADYRTAIGDPQASEEDFRKILFEENYNEASGTFPDGVTVSGLNPKGWGTWDDGIKISFDKGDAIGEGNNKLSIKRTGNVAADQDAITALSGGKPETGWLAMYKGVPYMYYNGQWRYFDNNANNGRANGREMLRKNMVSYLTGYKTGGLADFTGPAWLDGTPSKPEYVLNADQTERLFSLIDVLENMKSSGDERKGSGDNYFDININVEKLENDYSIEKVANKIRQMIYDDASYRNVNTINHIR
jgi:hypothetical protein